jgi:hypothetical protein
MGIQSAVLVHGRYAEPDTVLPGTTDYGERQAVECDRASLERRSAERRGQTEM